MTSGGHREGGEGGRRGREEGVGLQSNNGLHFIVEHSTTKDRVPKWAWLQVAVTSRAVAPVF